MQPSDLHCISVISNPIGFSSRARIMRHFLARQQASGVTQWVVEAVQRERRPEIADPANPNHIIVRADDELWLKENLIDIGARALPADAKYIAWVDADIAWHRQDWAAATLHQLQRFPVVQPFSHAVDLGPQREVLENHLGFAYCYQMGPKLGVNNTLEGFKYGGPYWHSGYAWAFRMETWNAMGGMLDRSLLGAADHHMAAAMLGRVDVTVHGWASSAYHAMCAAWQDRAQRAIKGQIGYVPGVILHAFHGWKPDRGYQSRWDILVNNAYDPERDVAYDRHGVLQFTTANQPLIDGCRAYFASRNEDAA